MLNLVQDNRKGIEAAAQQWKEGARTDAQFIKVLEVGHPCAAPQPAPLTPLLQSSGADVLAELLDAEQGSHVRDTGIFRAHAARYEAEFLEDMTRLGAQRAAATCTRLTLVSAGCLMPDVLTRVSEFIQPIIVYIQKIVARGLAYESNGSVCVPAALILGRAFNSSLQQLLIP